MCNFTTEENVKKTTNDFVDYMNSVQNNLLLESSFNVSKIDSAILYSRKESTFKKSFMFIEYKNVQHSIDNKSFILKCITQMVLTLAKNKDYEYSLQPPLYLGGANGYCDNNTDFFSLGFLPFYLFKTLIESIRSDNSIELKNIKPSDWSCPYFSTVYNDVLKISLKGNFKVLNSLDESLSCLKEVFISECDRNPEYISNVNFYNFFMEHKSFYDKVKTTLKSKRPISNFFLADLRFFSKSIGLSLSATDKGYYDSDLKKNSGFVFNSLETNLPLSEELLLERNNIYSNVSISDDLISFIEEHIYVFESQDDRQNKGSYHTKKVVTDKIQEFLNDVLGKNWKEDVLAIVDTSAGTGNLEKDLGCPEKIYLSTLDESDVEILKQKECFNPDSCFQADFLSLRKSEFKEIAPKGLVSALESCEKGDGKLLVIDNPPYNEDSGNSFRISSKGSASEKESVSNKTMVYKLYGDSLGDVKNELSIQFFVQNQEIFRNAYYLEISPMKSLNGFSSITFRKRFPYKLLGGFIISSLCFDSTTGNFPIAVKLWDFSVKEKLNNFVLPVYDLQEDKLVHVCDKKIIVPSDNKGSISNWVSSFVIENEEVIGHLGNQGLNFSQNNTVRYQGDYLTSGNKNSTPNSLIADASFFAVRKSLVPRTNWWDNKDNCLCPNMLWDNDTEFQNDCLVYLLSSNSMFRNSDDENNFIPFEESEVSLSGETFKSHFMKDFIEGRFKSNVRMVGGFRIGLPYNKESYIPKKPLQFSSDAVKVLDSMKALYRFYFEKRNEKVVPNKSMKDMGVNVSLHDIQECFCGTHPNGNVKSNSDFGLSLKEVSDEYNSLKSSLTECRKALEEKIYGQINKFEFVG